MSFISTATLEIALAWYSASHTSQMPLAHNPLVCPSGLKLLSEKRTLHHCGMTHRKSAEARHGCKDLTNPEKKKTDREMA